MKEIQPPVVSAIKIKGKKALETSLKQSEMQLRPLEIFKLSVSQKSPSEILLEAEVGGGTYIRSLAQEIGKYLGCGAHLSELKRVKHHGFEKNGSIFDPCEIIGEVNL